MSYLGSSHQVARLNSPNQIATSFSYDTNLADRRLTKISNYIYGSYPFHTYTYQTDKVDRITNLSYYRMTGWYSSDTEETKYLYDKNDQLTEKDYDTVYATAPATASLSTMYNRYNYDNFGNRKSMEVGGYRALDPTLGPSHAGTITNYSINDLNQLVTAGTRTIRHDAKGQIYDDGIRKYTWGTSGELLSVTLPNNKTIKYAYTGRGLLYRRTELAGAAVTSDTYYRWCGNKVCREHNVVGNLATRRYDGGELRGTVNTAGQLGATQNYFYFKDHLGTVQDVVYGADNFVVSYTYDEWGRRTNAINHVSGFELTSGYTGHLYDTEAELVFAPHRVYDPALGRWISRDPIGEAGGENLYAYVRNNPLNWIDPFGLEAGVTIWQPVGWGGSSFGHASTDVNGTTYSFGPGGMSILPTSEYLDRNGFRDGTRVNLKLPSEKEAAYEACLRRSQGGYDAFSNNCASPAQRCLREVGVDDFYKQGGTTLGVNGNHVLPVDLGNGLLSSGAANGATNFPATRTSDGSSAPWAK